MSLVTELNWFEKSNYTFKKKFYMLMNLLVSNQSAQSTEVIILMGIFYIQILSGFFSAQVQVFDPANSTSDQILTYLLKITRIKELLESSYNEYKIIIYVVLVATILLIIFFLIECYNCSSISFYTLRESILNYSIKIYIFIVYNIVLDWTWSNFCFESDEGVSPHFKDTSCKWNSLLTILSVLLFIIINFLVFFIIQFYTDSLFFSNNPYAKISCNYETYMTMNCLVYSVLLIQVKYLSKELFLLYNFIISGTWLNFYYNSCVFYFQLCNMMGGLFHVLYFWTSIFCLIFAYIDFNEKGIIYIISSGIVLYFYINWKYKFEEKLLLITPFYKITNKYYLLYYIKSIIDKINKIDQSQQEKALLTGIIQMHCIECPNPKCLTKNKNKIYLPIASEWSDRSKAMINDRVFIVNFIIVIINYFIEQNYYSPQILINLSLYYLEIIRNYCLALFFYKKVKEMNLTIQENFSYIRLQHIISKTLVSKLKIENEPCLNWEDWNVTYYFKYADWSQKLFDEMNNDITFSLEFWRCFKASKVEVNTIIDFNKVFHLTDQIRITKIKVEKLWNKWFEIYNGCNDWFDLYSNYVESINDDDWQKRDWEEIRRKTENSAEWVQQNYYSVWFNKETGIIIANGDKGKEGLIEKTNNEIEKIFKYKPEELKGINVSQLMPKLFAKDHKMFMSKYFEIGEKRVIDQKDMKSFGKDKDNSWILIRIALKLFPVINENVFFVSLITKENIDDIIFIDNKFNIQGMSSKLMSILNVDNKYLFVENEIPFYVICKKFVNFYKIFLHSKKRKQRKTRVGNPTREEINMTNNTWLYDTNIKENSNVEPGNVSEWNNDLPNESEEGDEWNGNIQINENIELEYEIKIPKYIYSYASILNKKEKHQDIKIATQTGPDTHGTNIGAMEMEEYSENDLLVNEPVTTNINNNGNTRGGPETVKGTDGNANLSSKSKIALTATGKGGSQDEFNKQSEEEKEFNLNLNKSREYFLNAQFNEWEEFIDENNKEEYIKEYKFNFTFDRHKYGNHLFAYIVRCIDNKMEGNKSDGNSIGEENDEKISRVRKEKNEGWKFWYELWDHEKSDWIVKKDAFIQLSWEDREFQKILNRSKQEIMDTSMVLGKKKEDIVEDETASQMGGGSFNDNLCKKNHIEEIRANIMLNVANFFTLKYIKINLGLVFFSTCIFIVILIWFILDINDTLKEVSSVNTKWFQSSWWMCNWISSLISMRAWREFKKNNRIYNFNSYINDNSDYFDRLGVMSGEWYGNIIHNFSDVEYHIDDFVDDYLVSFWNKQQVLYNFDKDSKSSVDDTESFPWSYNQILSNVNGLLKHSKFISDFPPATIDEEEQINFASFLSIENAYENWFPQHFQKLKDLPIKFKDYNSKSLNKIIIVISIYFVFVFILNIVYSVLLYITNKSMGEGWEKVNKIKLDKIEETIKKIEMFGEMIKSYRDKDNNKVNKTRSYDPENAEDNFGQNQFNRGNNNYSWDSTNHKKWSIWNYSYLQTWYFLAILCSFLIPLIILSNEMVASTNKLINVQAYMFGKLLIASASTVKVKCMMSECKTTTVLEYDWIIKSNIQSIVQSISIFSALDDFYNNKFLLNACDSAFSNTSQEYQNCMKDILIQSANNTDSLLKFVEETVDGIYKEKEMKTGEKVEINGSEMDFVNDMLFSSSNFSDLEKTLYLYLVPVANNLAQIILSSWDDYWYIKIWLIILLVVFLTLSMLALTIYLCVFFVNKLIHLISVSRCILKIIPTNVITSTQDWESWIESKY